MVYARIRAELYDRYCVTAQREGIDVVEVVQRVLSEHAPKPAQLL